MPKFEVDVKVTLEQIYTYEVEAKDAEEAREIYGSANFSMGKAEAVRDEIISIRSKLVRNNEGS